MLRPRLKICGVASPASAEQLDGLVSYVGTVVAPPGLSPRAVTASEARAVAATLHSSTHVTVAAGMGPWEALEAAVEADSGVLQPHMELGPGVLERLLLEAERLGLRVAPVLVYRGRGGWAGRLREVRAVVEAYPGTVEYVLIDAAKGTSPPPRGQGWGLRVPGEALREAVEALRGAATVAAAGGVSAGNACRAVELGAGMVDVSSWADRPGMPGVKDLGRVALLVEALRSCGGGGGG